jgi:subtilase family serine protease
LFKFYEKKTGTLIILAMLVLVIISFPGSFPGIRSTTSASATTIASDWTAQPLYRVNGVAAQGPAQGSAQGSATVTPYTPNQIITAYDLTSTTNGTGTTIAIIDAYNDPNVASDLAYFSSTFNLPAANFVEHQMSPGIPNNSSWGIEISLDVEWAHAIAPNATILLVEASSNSLTDLLAAVNYATASPAGVPPVKAVSMSWGGSEFSGENTYDSNFTSTSGIVFFASSGDNGAGVIWPSSSSNVVGVGGTTLNVTSTGAVISETAWNDSGGGVSAYESQPVYQANYGLTYAKRSTPDVSYDADPNTGVYVYDTYGESGWYDVGGTSAGAPQWAAIQALGKTCGNTNFYQDGSPSSYFRDITSGSNGYPAGTGYDLVTGLGSPITTNFTTNVTPQNGYLVVRGENNGIYYRIYNSTTASWNNWNSLPDGSTFDSPTAAVVSNTMYVVVRGIDNASLWFSSLNLTNNNFSGWTQLSGSTPSTPTLTGNSTTLYLIVRGTNNNIYYRYYNIASQTWSGWTSLPTGTTIDSPTAKLQNNVLHIVVRGANNNQIWYSNINLTNNNFSGWTALDGATPSAPTLTGNSTTLCLVVRGETGTIFYRFDNITSQTWTSWTALPSGTTPDSPSATILTNTLLIAVVGSDGSSLWTSSMNLGTNTFSGWTQLNGSTTSKPTLTS